MSKMYLVTTLEKEYRSYKCDVIAESEEEARDKAHRGDVEDRSMSDYVDTVGVEEILEVIEL